MSKATQLVDDTTVVSDVQTEAVTIAAPAKNTVTLNIPNPFHLNFILENSGNGTVAPRVTHSNALTLSKGTIYKLPIVETHLSYDNFYAIKITATFREKIEVLDVSEGNVSIRPIIHGTILNDGDIVAELL